MNNPRYELKGNVPVKKIGTMKEANKAIVKIPDIIGNNNSSLSFFKTL